MFQKFPEDRLYICAIALGELQSEIKKLAENKKPDDQILWFERVKDSFQNQIRPIDNITALKWGSIVSLLKKRGIKIPV